MRPTACTGALFVITVAGLGTVATPRLLASVCPGPLFPAPQFAIPGYDPFIDAADLDGDGNDDIAAASTASVSVLLAVGNGLFAEAVIAIGDIS